MERERNASVTATGTSSARITRKAMLWMPSCVRDLDLGVRHPPEQADARGTEHDAQGDLDRTRHEPARHELSGERLTGGARPRLRVQRRRLAGAREGFEDGALDRPSDALDRASRGFQPVPRAAQESAIEQRESRYSQRLVRPSPQVRDQIRIGLSELRYWARLEGAAEDGDGGDDSRRQRHVGEEELGGRAGRTASRRA